MFKHRWKKEILTIPNLLSLLRLVMIPVYIRLYLRAASPDEFLGAATLMGASCLTDLLDGWIARRFQMVSTLGKILDPLADKLTQLSMAVCLSLAYPALKTILALFTVKELGQLALALVHLTRGYMLPGALMAGKVCTAVLFISFIFLALSPDVPADTVNAIVLTDGRLRMLSFVSYVFAYLGRHPLPRQMGGE